MHLKRPAVFFVLLALFLAAVATRSSTRDRLDSPYFRGTSAMVYAHALRVADGLPIDTLSLKANHPAGYTPARYRADGFERAWGAAFRAARYVSEADGRDFARHTVVLLSALCVFTMYALTRRVWDCQAAGLLAAFLVAVWSPWGTATNGRAFTHTTLVPLFLTAHAVLVLSTLTAMTRRAAWLRLVSAALAAFVLLTSWEPAPYWVAAWSVGLALWGHERWNPRALVVAHAIAVLVACVVSSHLIATRGIGSLATALVAACALGPFVGARLAPSRSRRTRIAIGLGAAVLLWVAMIPVRAGATEQFPALAYWSARARFLFGGPDSPAALSDWMRHVWSLDHAPLAPDTAIAFFLPVLPLAAAFLLNREARARRRAFTVALVAAALASVAVLIDRSTLPVAAATVAVAVCGAGISVSKSVFRRAPLVALAAVLALTATLFRNGTADPAYQIARAAGVAHQDPYAFLWVSFENTDRELVRFVATRTSVRESLLAPDDLSALLFAFTGRTVTLLPGAASRAPSERHVALTRALYASEEELYETCRANRIDYVVYSIDALLGTGRYSPRYLAGGASIDPASIAYRMHFDPESLRRFTLRYENDHYRLFEVTETPEPIFATDHPPFYQTALLAKANHDVEAFRRLSVEVMLTYAEARRQRARGNAEGAGRRLEWCLQQAPRYTQARIALADALMDLGKYEDARNVIAVLVGYAPDNTNGLYYLAYIDAQMGRTEEAKSYLTLLMSIERDPDRLQRARVLKAALDSNALPRGAPRDP